MVAPFKPYTELIQRFATTPLGYRYPIYRKHQSGVRQKSPYVDTEYVMNLQQTLFGEADAGSWSVDPDGVAVFARNLARASFVNNLGEASQFGSTLTSERKATWGTVVDSITKAALAAKAVARGKFGKAAYYLGIEPPKKVVKKRTAGSKRSVSVRRYSPPGGSEASKSLGNKWLWFSYGVLPLMKDIYNGMDILQRPTPELKISGRGTSTHVEKTQYYIYSYKSSVRCSAMVSVNNPNLWLANQMGLVNPVQMVNEGIPFSFVIDWFSNLSQVISQMTDFVGLDIAKPVTTELNSVVDERIPPFAPAAKKYTRFRRVLSIPQAKLVFAYERFSWQRGLNAVSLLLQFLPSKR